MNPKVEDFLNNVKNWKAELEQLRMIILSCGLNEDFKWRVPCYTNNGKNILLIQGFKNYCAIAFFKGALLKDTKKLLYQQTENVQSSRLIRFTKMKDIIALELDIRNYIFEAIEIESAGLKVESASTKDLQFPEELYLKFSNDKKFEQAFLKLSPGRQRAYNLFFTAGKQSDTRVRRIEQMTERIMKGKGMHDCICGLSKRMPTCDGSHKLLK